MSSSKFRDLSAGSKSLILIEQVLFACALFLAVYVNNVFSVTSTQEMPNSFFLD